MTQRPDLFGAALPAVGVMDMLRFHKFTDRLGLGRRLRLVGRRRRSSRRCYAYSPLHNLQARHALSRRRWSPPPTTTTASCPAHSFKFAAALQAAQAGDDPVLIRIETKAGHGAGKPTSKLIEEAADQWAFLTATLGVTVKPIGSNCNCKLDATSATERFCVKF